jgi:hypothetical protein
LSRASDEWTVPKSSIATRRPRSRSRSISFADQYRAVFHLGQQQRPGHAHIVWEFIGTHAEYEREC